MLKGGAIVAKIISLVDRAVLPLPKLKKVAAYARVSSGKDEMLHSLSAQVSYYSQLIQNHAGWEYVGVYSDKAYTGTKNERPQFQKLLSDCKLGKVDMIITKSISRFARNTLDTLNVTRSLKDLGVDVYFEKERIHSISSDGELMLTILASFAQGESLSVSENCKWRIRKQFKQGISTSSKAIGYDYKDNEFEIVPEEAKIVKMIFSDYLSGAGLHYIAKKLINMGIKTYHNKKWSRSTLRKILQNEKYTGDLILQKTFIKDHLSKQKCINKGELPKYHIKDDHEAIIDKDTFLRVQNEFKKRAESSSKVDRTKKYPFTSKIKCGLCGKNFNRKISAKGTNYEKIIWLCSTFNTYGKKYCPSSRVPHDVLEKLSAEVLKTKEFDTELFNKEIEQIIVPSKGILEFVFKNGNKIQKTWHYASRSESWTDEKKKLARERALRKESKVEYSEKCNSYTCNA